MAEVGATTPTSKVMPMSSAEMPSPVNPGAMFFQPPRRFICKPRIERPIFQDIADKVDAHYEEALRQAMALSAEALVKEKSLEAAKVREAEAHVEVNEATSEALEASRMVSEASQFKNSTDETIKKKYEVAVSYAQKAEEKVKHARDKEQDMILAVKAASQKTDQAMKAVKIAYARAELIKQAENSLKDGVWNETDGDTAAEAAVAEDNIMSRNYSKYVSYTRDEKHNYPIMSWTLSEEQLEILQKKFIIARKLNREQVMPAIDHILDENACRIKAKESFYFKIPKRKAEFLQYSRFLAMPLLLRGHNSKRSFTDGRTKRQACLTVWLLNELYLNVREKKFLTLRDIFYLGTQFFKKPKEAAELLADICCMLECTASSLNVIPDETGSVIGGITLKMKDAKDKDVLKCHSGVRIPYDVNNISEVIVDDGIQFVLVVEKGTIYNHFRQADIPKTNDCVMVTAYGMPDERTRSFLRLVEENTGLPIFGLTDPDPYGISIMKTYAKGSTNLAHSNIRLAVPSIHWLGITTFDIQALEKSKNINILNRCPRLNSRERVMLTNMMVSNKYELSGEWRKLIKHMLDTNRKACFEVLHVFGRNFVTEEHFPFLINRVMDSMGK